MTTSGVTTGLYTARDIIRDAMQEIGVLAGNASASAEDEELGVRRLNTMLKEWQLDGANIWRTEDITIAWPAATREADVAPGITEVQSLSVVDSYDRRLTRWDRDQIASLPNRATAGAPTVYATIKRRASLGLMLWPVPAGTTTLKATIARTIEDVTDPTETLDVPQEFTTTVVMGLAARLVGPFGRADENTIITVREATRLYNVLRAFDRPASYLFEKG